MTLDIKGGLKNTEISSNKYVVIYELVSNAIDSYLIRKSNDLNVPNLSIVLDINLISCNSTENDCDLEISCTDNGAGFGGNQIRAFVTKDSTYKDYLKIQGLGKCKGAGRIQFFHYFKNFQIESVTLENDNFLKRSLSTGENVHEITEESFSIQNLSKSDLLTTITLSGLKENILQEQILSSGLKNDFSVNTIFNYLYVAFMQRFIILRGIAGKFKVTVLSGEGENVESREINSDELPSPVSVEQLPLYCAHGTETLSDDVLKITRFSLPVNSSSETEHEIALCANSALVKSITKDYLKNKKDRSQPVNDKLELLLIESEFLERKVNEQRDGFNIPSECSHTLDFDNNFSMEDVINSLEDYVFGILTPSDFNRDELIKSTENKFGISRSMIDEANIRVRFSDSEQNIAKRVLKKYQNDIVDDTSKIFDLRQELINLDPTTDDFREKVNDLSWVYTSSIKKMDMANLSQLVVRRSSMIEVLKQAVKLMLDCQNNDKGRYEHERIIHNVFFPTGKDSKDSIDHDIWILNEEYHYFEHIASDKSLATIPWNEDEKLFELDIDEQLEKLFSENNKNHSRKRPDIAIFNQEGSAIIIEFKAPGVEIQDHTQDLVQYARLIAAKSKGRIKKVYGYLIGDSMDETRIPPNYTKFPSGLGYFSSDRLIDHSTGSQYGELYSEVLFYEQFIDRAESRLKVYEKRLNFSV